SCSLGSVSGRPLSGTAPVQVAVVSGASPDDASGGAASEGAASGGAEPGGAGSEGAGSRGAEPESVEPGGAESEGAESGGAEPRGAALSRGPVGASPRLSSQQLREWLVRRPHRQSGAPGAGGAIDSGAGGDPDAPDIPTPRSYAEAITGPYSSQWQAAMDAEMASWKSTGTYVDEVLLGANSHCTTSCRLFVRVCVQRQGVDYFQTFSPTPKMTTLQVFLHVAAQRDYELHSLDFSTAFLQGSLHEEIWLRRPPGFTGTFPAGTTHLVAPVSPLFSPPIRAEAPHEWHDTLRIRLAALGFAPATADPSLFLRIDTWLPPFYVLVYVDDLVFARADTEALILVKSELQKRHTCIDLGELTSYLGLQITRDRAQRTITLTQSHMVHQVLQHFGFQYSSPQLTPLSTSHSLLAPPVGCKFTLHDILPSVCTSMR
ncbi:unnamed protein product, partial [Closterium sp. NIES-54]